MPAFFRMLDTNHDGRLSPEELAKAGDLFEKLDLNHDGFLDPKELMSPPQTKVAQESGPTIRPGKQFGKKRNGEHMIQMIMRADANGDGKISLEEAPPQLKSTSLASTPTVMDSSIAASWKRGSSGCKSGRAYRASRIRRLRTRIRSLPASNRRRGLSGNKPVLRSNFPLAARCKAEHPFVSSDACFASTSSFSASSAGSFKPPVRLSPSSRHLARAMTRQMAAPRGPATILEVGPGTGGRHASHFAAAPKGRPPRPGRAQRKFCESFRERFETIRLPVGGESGSGACLRNRDISSPKLLTTSSYPGLPFAKFLRPLRGAALECHVRPLAPGGRLAYFEYMYMRSIRKVVVGTNRTQSAEGIGSCLEWIFVADIGVATRFCSISRRPGCSICKRNRIRDRRGRMTSDISPDILPRLALIR